MYVNYRDMQRKLQLKEPFNGNSAWATSTKDDRGLYVYRVYSYDTLIAKHDGTQGGWELNNNYFSSTTSRLQNMIIRAWGLPVAQKRGQ